MAFEKTEMKELASLADLKFDGVPLELDPAEDAWSFAPPPPRDVYDLKLFLAKDGWKYGLVDPKDPQSLFIQATLECRIASSDPEIDGSIVYSFVSTKVGKRKSISTMAGLIIKCGFKLPQNTLTAKQQAQLFEKVLKKEPLVKGEVDWRGAYSFKNKKDEDEWVNVYNHYNEFPDDGKGGKLSQVSLTTKSGDNVQIRAQTQVARFFGKGDQIPTKADLVGTTKVSVNGNGLVTQQVSAPEPALELATPAPTPAPKIVPTSTVAPTVVTSTPPSDEADMELLLA